ncbi:MAG: STAS domain-containing protein [Aurantimonas endophytica]|uniref:Chemotaxis protein CheX n=1 Tax=Aurantimonas endophytica TaxID=1522175 RepID=A0A7W6MP11_9HYPH|nr:STAS domain-containing protein [Aurantimonas endophytica]MBB4002505.1 chemotaxis protein CheX [Aurantimonas endophytica]MCO6401874.1 STAS domain-containing protein [Aurantimonas endophytica]
MARRPTSLKPAAIDLSAVLDLKAAGPLCDQLVELRGKPIVLDASGVSKVGGQCVQVLLAAAATWQADAVSFKIAEPSEAFRNSVELMGLSGTLSDRDTAA